MSKGMPAKRAGSVVEGDDAREPDDLAHRYRGWVDPLIGVELTRDGISGLLWDRKKSAYSRGLLDMTKPLRLAAAWRADASVAAAYRMGDFFALLRKMSPAVLDLLEELTGSSVAPFFTDLAGKAGPRNRGRWALAAVEVSRWIEIDHHEGKRKSRRISDRVGACGVLKRAHVSPTGHRDRVVALELTPWSELVAVPLRIGKTGSLRQRFWKSCKPRSIVVNMPEWKSSRRLAKQSEAEFTLDGVTLGELFQAIFDELCFTGSPEGRNHLKEELSSRIESL
jgi:hypothetical protein